MKITTAFHILDPESDSLEQVATFTFETGWAGARGKWTDLVPVTHPAEPDPLVAYAEVLVEHGYRVETEEGEEDFVEGRIY